MALTIRKGDTVVVLAGKDRGKQGKVQRVIPNDQRVIVEGINLAKKHRKPTRQVMQGGIVEQPAPLHVSNVMVVCKQCGEPTRIATRVSADGSRARECKRCGETIDG
ncbi:MAG: 50S ribosomal protein L24 [Thermaerobacterales bacterium]